MLREDTVAVEIRGNLDRDTVSQPRKFLADVTTDATRHLVIDLAGLRFLDSSGVALLIAADCETGVHACGCAIRIFIRSPGRPKMLRISAGSSPVLPNQCGTVVSNSATSPGPSTQSWSPRTRRMWPDRT